MLGLLSLGGAGSLPWVGAISKNTSNLSLGCTPLQAILMQVPTRTRPHVSWYIHEDFLKWIIPSMY